MPTTIKPIDALLDATFDVNIPVYLDVTSLVQFATWGRDNVTKLVDKVRNDGLQIIVFEEQFKKAYPNKKYREQAQDSLTTFEVNFDEIEWDELNDTFATELEGVYFYDETGNKRTLRSKFLVLARHATTNHRKLQVITASPSFQRVIDGDVFYVGSLDELNAKSAVMRTYSAIFGEPSSDNTYQCDVFMVMPFAAKFTPIYEQLVKPIVEDLRLTIKRGDDPMTDENIMQEVWSMLNACKVVIADCTDLNANVFYEIGMAHSIGKQVIPLIQDASQLPFDIRHRRAIVYNTSFDKVDEFKRRLKETLRTILNLS